MLLLIQQSLGLKLSIRLKVYRSYKTASSCTIVSSTLLRVLLPQECYSIQLLFIRLIINHSLVTLVEPSCISSYNYAITSLIKARTSTSTMLITILVSVYTYLEIRSLAFYTCYQYLSSLSNILQLILSTIQRVRLVIT